MQNQTSQDQSVFRLLDWILHYTLFHRTYTLGSHLREEGSLDYDGGLVRLQVQMNFDTTINCQQPTSARLGHPFLHVDPLAVLHLDPFNCIILATSSSRPR
jgi:hypothetical protein